MSTAVAPASPRRTPRRSLGGVPPLALQLLAFAGLAAFCLAHYERLVEPGAGGRLLALVAIATAGGAALAATRPLPRGAGTVVRALILLLVTVAALGATGLELRLLGPRNWDEFGDGLATGFAEMDSFQWPYSGDEEWVRLTILLAMPVLAVLAAALAFWPAKRGATALRTAALVPLLLAYGTGVANLHAGGWALRGAALLLLMAAFLWLPRLRERDALFGIGAVVACALAAMPLGAGLDARDPWIDYRSWEWFDEQTDGTSFAWDHTYGPIGWSRTGRRLLAVRSEEPHYWKAQSLTRFDGLRWIHTESTVGTGDPVGEIPEPIRPAWNERIRFTVRELETRLVVGAGTVYRVDADRAVAEEPDGTVRLLDSYFREGDRYTVYSYIPDPSADEMRAAPRDYPERLTEYTWFDLPRGDQSGLDPPDLSEDERHRHLTTQTIRPAVANAPLAAADLARVGASPYGRTYRLARRLAAGQSTTYDVVRSVEGWLQRELDYSERPPLRRYPLHSFLFEDRIGYCQQFSGAMTLMLRMNGIPARVASGFSPGSLNKSTGQYEVRDLDAHSWVEVWFSGIGWVPFDPTPSLAPAGSQASGANAPSAARGAQGGEEGPVPRGQRDVTAPDAPAAPGEGGPMWLLVLGLAGLAAVGLAALWLAGMMRARPHFASSAEGAVQELRVALDRLGYRFPAGTTLTELERRLRVTNGDGAARYVAGLRSLRYEPPGDAHAPGPHARRELRRALTAGSGPLGRLRGLLALPPRRRAY